MIATCVWSLFDLLIRVGGRRGRGTVSELLKGGSRQLCARVPVLDFFYKNLSDQLGGRRVDTRVDNHDTRQHIEGGGRWPTHLGVLSGRVGTEEQKAKTFWTRSFKPCLCLASPAVSMPPPAGPRHRLAN